MAVSLIEKWLRNKWVQHSLRLSMAILVTSLLSQFTLDVFESYTYDMRMRWSPSPDPSGQVVLIPIDSFTVKRLKRDPEALDWAVVIQKLAQANPKHVVSFINPSQIQGSYDDLSLLADIFTRVNFTFGENDLPNTGTRRLDPLAAPFEQVRVAPAAKTADSRLFARDGVTRRLMLTYNNQFVLHPKIAADYNGFDAAEDYSGVFNFLDSKQMLIRFRSKGSHTSISFLDILENNIDPALLRDKIILIGRDTMDNANDYISTPLKNELLGMSLLEMHANILDTLIMDDSPRQSPDWVKALFTFLLSLLTIYVVLFARPARGLMMLATALGFFLLFTLVVFATFRWIIPIANPLIGILICYYFLIPYRLIIENRRSWEYYQKNRLLEQVEELKSNFMRMMSHDLRTPLARIQGMADVILKEDVEFSETQKLALDTIKESSEELTEFIGSILSLSRIESKELKLQLRSRDINQLVREVIRKTDYLAKRKNIEIVTELEPLFSIKVDEDLLKTVLTNLVENAIKYSNENTRILISTEENDRNEVEIQVADQGRGIPQEDVIHIFDRFYRARNSRGNTPGTGLGLYLAKYFVELHNGAIDAESVLDKGSTFTVYLPMDLSQEFDQSEIQGGLHV
jgi:signal transduction histidine kinase